MSDQPDPQVTPPPPAMLELVGNCVGEMVTLHLREDTREMGSGYLRAVDAVGVVVEIGAEHWATPWSALRRLDLPTTIPAP